MEKGEQLSCFEPAFECPSALLPESANYLNGQILCTSILFYRIRCLLDAFYKRNTFSILILDNVGFSDWGSWGDCSVMCNGGRRQRTRHCIDQSVCRGPTTKQEQCNTQPCKSKKYAVFKFRNSTLPVRI